MKRIGQTFRENLVSRVKDGVGQNGCIFVVSYSQVPASQINDFRKRLKAAGADVYVSKNSIAQIALKDLNQSALAERITGQMAFVWSQADSAEVVKALVKFVKECENIKIRGGLLDGRIIEKDQIVQLSELPSRKVLLTMLLSTIQSPLTRLAGALSGKTQELLSILKQLSEKKGGN
ncbi:MAG: 50S ribosomal protein L10 [Candidatus Sungbacteria bacterium RIFCSPHIGHO2_02_FULL_47_11]|uniref:Large ribosomal subunit protein uL10 n=1 Tax=Candidatus Sungbacteria bacterium RIFCSPHIGHO2_02_FULL_47_11 TaxID=1802270 RepID=A0A1G2KNE5_9BACT|nr:MAG: 50S ribosomal protein L10 [Candidatus Sungbacteria bacterium RIFCSPHIGHO2_02_FULL_47_11]